MFDVRLLVLVQVDLEESGTVEAEPDPLANDLCGIDEVIEDGAVHGDERAAARTLLFLLVHFPRRLGQDPPLGNEDYVLARELLLKLTNQTGLDLLEGLLLRHGNKDHNGLLALDLDLLGSGDVELTEVLLEVRIHLEVQEGLRDCLLEVVGSVAIRLDNLGTANKSHLKKKGRKET